MRRNPTWQIACLSILTMAQLRTLMLLGALTGMDFGLTLQGDSK
ncbi:MAG: hypothetical protein M2R45_04948 [Verrucomicrobia subdivision 3 bacterium]|nr:hypothetical protein [Limisphaerales bacterium]MCS1415615.1 hypothetical protein [Limisphaerales bacterium]